MTNPAVIISWVGLAMMVPLLILAEHRIERSRGRIWKYHLIYAAVVAAVILGLPTEFKFDLFSPLGVVIIGTVFPIYESIRAVCTPQGKDDKSWLQYWIAQGVVTYTTSFVDDLAKSSESVREYFYQAEFIFLLWLLLPWTDGAALVYDYITLPLCARWMDKVAQKMNNVLTNIVTTVISAAHLWVLWAVFLFFPPSFKRFITVSVGVVYPLIASVVAVSTENTYDDDTFWLTYWSCYGCLYLIMDFLETWLGRIPGFYTVVLFSSVYLMLPLFRGAEKIFRNVLVPLAGLQEMLLLRDALVVKKTLVAQIPDKSRRSKIRSVIAASFQGSGSKSRSSGGDGDSGYDTDEDDDPLVKYSLFGSVTADVGSNSGNGNGNHEASRSSESTPLVV